MVESVPAKAKKKDNVVLSSEQKSQREKKESLSIAESSRYSEND